MHPALILAAVLSVSPPVPVDEAGWYDVPAKDCQAIERRYKRKAFFLEMAAFVAKGIANRDTAELVTDSGERATITAQYQPSLNDVAWASSYYQPQLAQALTAANCPAFP